MARPKPSLSKVYYQISEVALLTGVNESTLRNWEGQYNELNQIRRINRRRHYTAKDIAVIERIRNERSAKRQKRAEKTSTQKPIEGKLFTEPSPGKVPTQTKTRPSTKHSKLVRELKQIQAELRDISKSLDK